jgi:gamma-polyglutamate biosynthesis protein CapA
MKFRAAHGFILIVILVLAGYFLIGSAGFSRDSGTHGDAGNAPLRMVFTGDVMLSRDVGGIISRHGPEFPFEQVHDILRSGDITMGNLESPVSGLDTTACDKTDQHFCLKASPGVMPGLTYAGFDIMNLANNHAMDYQSEVLNDTMVRLSGAGIRFTGVQQREDEPYEEAAIIHEPGMDIAFLGFDDVDPTGNVSIVPRPWNASMDTVVRSVKEARKKADIVVVNFHFGEEYNHTH